MKLEDDLVGEGEGIGVKDEGILRVAGEGRGEWESGGDWGEGF